MKKSIKSISANAFSFFDLISVPINLCLVVRTYVLRPLLPFYFPFPNTPLKSDCSSYLNRNCSSSSNLTDLNEAFGSVFPFYCDILSVL